MHDEVLEKIETKLAFLERSNIELSDVVYQQQRLIDALHAQLVTLEARMRESQEHGEGSRTPEDERPPHY